MRIISVYWEQLGQMYFVRPIAAILAIAGLFAVLTALVTALPGHASAAEQPLPLPRFVSLKSSEVNLRTGPGIRYPIEWVYQRRGLPVEITAEFDNWRRVRDAQGAVGWIHRSLLSGRRTAMVVESERLFRRQPQEDAPGAFRAAAGVLVEIITCDSIWCQMVQGETTAWTRQKGLWGVYPGEKIK